MPIGATIATESVLSPVRQSVSCIPTTFGGNPLACAAALATINVLLGQNLPAPEAEQRRYVAGRFPSTGAEYPDLVRKRVAKDVDGD